MKKKFLALLLAAIMVVTLLPTVAFASAEPDFTPVQYGTGGDSTEATVEDLHPGDTLSVGVEFDVSDQPFFFVFDDLTDFFFKHYERDGFHINDDTLEGTELSAAFEGGGDFDGETLMVVDNYRIGGGPIYLVPVVDMDGSDSEVGYGVFVYDENANGGAGDLIPVTSANKDNVLGDGKISYNPDDKILTLDGAEINAVGPAIVSWLPDLTIKPENENSIEYTLDQERFYGSESVKIGVATAIAAPFGGLSVIGTDPATDKLTVELNMDNCSKNPSLDVLSAVISVWGGEYYNEDGTDSKIGRPANFTIKDAAMEISCPSSQYFDDSGNLVDYDVYCDSWWETGSYWEIHTRGIEADGNALLQNAVVSVASGNEGILCNYGGITIENCKANGDGASIAVTSQGGDAICCYRGDMIIDGSKINITPNGEKTGFYCVSGNLTIRNGSEVNVTTGSGTSVSYGGVTIENSTVTADGGILGNNIVITDSAVTAGELNCVALTVNGSESVVKSIADGEDATALFLHEDWDTGAAPSLNVNDGLVQFTGTVAGIMVMAAEGTYEPNDLTLVGSTEYFDDLDDFENATETVTIEWYGDYDSYISMIGGADGEIAKSVQIGSAASPCTYPKKVATPVSGETYQLKLNCCDKGEFTFETNGGSGWYVKNGSGKYLNAVNGKLVLGDPGSTAWTYKNGAFSTTVTTTETTGGHWLLFLYIPGKTRTVTTTYYLNRVDAGDLSKLYVGAALYEKVSGDHCFSCWVNCLDGEHHKRVCRHCGEVETEHHDFGANGQAPKCLDCGAVNPAKIGVEISVNVKSRTVTRHSGFLYWGMWEDATVHTASIKTHANGVAVMLVEYQLNDGLWTPGVFVRTLRPIDTLKVRVLASNGEWYHYEYHEAVTIETLGDLMALNHDFPDSTDNAWTLAGDPDKKFYYAYSSLSKEYSLLDQKEGEWMLASWNLMPIDNGYQFGWDSGAGYAFTLTFVVDAKQKITSIVVDETPDGDREGIYAPKN